MEPNQIKQQIRHLVGAGNFIESNLGNYSNLYEIGQGKHSIVYSGTFLRKEFAIKILASNLTGDLYKNKELRFIAEYNNALQIKDNSLFVKILSLETIKIGNAYYNAIMMEKCEYNLISYKDNVGANKENILKLFIFLLKSLTLLHDSGIIHRDIKAGNVLFNGVDFVLSDFGIAHFVDDNKYMTVPVVENERLCNSYTSPPEQYESFHTPMYNMDIYSFGKLFTWFIDYPRIDLLSDIEAFKKIKFSDFINRCTTNEPSDRFQTIEEVIEYLDFRYHL